MFESSKKKYKASDSIYNGIIYKYLSPEDGIRTLSNSTIFLQNPSKFNDPFDCYEEVVQFPDAKQYATDLLLSGKTKVPKEMMRLARNQIGNNQIDVISPFKDSLTEMKDKIGISCFSKNFNNKLMWSHYGDKHNGICIGFEFQIITTDYFIVLVDYVDKLEKANYRTDKEEMLKKWLYTKSSDWRYEEEVRLISLNKQGVVKVAKKAFKHVVFGAKSEPKFKNKILNTISSKSYEVDINYLALDKEGFNLINI